MTHGADKAHIWREPSVGRKATSIGKGFTVSHTTRKRGGTTGSQIPKGTDIEIEPRIKKETRKAGRKGIGTKRDHDFRTAIKTLKADPREKVEILKRRMPLKVKSGVTRRRKRERKVGRGIENEIVKRIAIGITKTGTTVTEVKAKGKSHKGRGCLLKFLNKQTK